MRRKIFVFLIVAVVLVGGIRFFAAQNNIDENPNKNGVNLVQYKPLTPLANPILAEMQNLVDRISDSALKNNWNEAIKAIKELEQTWNSLRTAQTNKLSVEEEISSSIQSLHYNVYGQNKQEVLAIAQKLTELIGKLSQ